MPLCRLVGWSRIATPNAMSPWLAEVMPGRCREAKTTIGGTFNQHFFLHRAQESLNTSAIDYAYHPCEMIEIVG